MYCTENEIKDAEMEDAEIRSRKHLNSGSGAPTTLLKPNNEFKAKNRQLSSRQEFRKLKHRLGSMLGIKLVDAVNTNNIERVKTLLESGVNPNITDSEKRSALHVAVSRGYVDIVKLLLKYGADPNKRDIIQNTPLHLAACVHNLAIVTMLINANADVSCLDLHGRNPFQLASSKLQILKKSFRDGTIEVIKLKQELRDVVDLLLSMLMKDIEQKMERINHSDVDDLQIMKLSLSTDPPPEELDNQMSKLLSGIEKFQIS